MVDIVKAHIKNNSNQDIRIVIYDPATGAILKEETMSIAPNYQGLVEARERIKGQYQDFSYTSEGFPEAPMSDLEEARSVEEIVDRRDDITRPIVVTKADGSLAIEGRTTTMRDAATAGAQTDAAIDREIRNFEDEDQPTTLSVVPSAGTPPDIVDQLDYFELDDFVDGSGEERAELLRIYGEDLKNKFMVAGSDFSVEPPPPAQRPTRPLCAADTDREIRENIDINTINLRGNVYEMVIDESKKKAKKNKNLKPCDDDAPATTPDSPPQIKKPVVPKVKKSVQQEGASKEQMESLEGLSEDEKIKSSGTYGDHMLDPVPDFRQAKTEKVISNRYNSWIVLGRDRTDNLGSGFGGKGNTQCGAIDIVVGRMSPNPRAVDRKNKPMTVDPIFNTARDPGTTGRAGSPAMDAARIYLSQKTYVDQNFRLAPGRIGNNEEKPIQKDSNPRSAIALKADGVRVIAREGIKLITGVDGYNSQGGLMTARKGVDIIAGNGQYKGSELQPMILGNNMVECVNDLSEILSETVGAVQSIIKHIAILEAALGTHIHITAGPGPTSPSPSLAVLCATDVAKLASIDTFSSAAGKWNINKWRYQYTRAGAKKSIRSKYNNVN